MDTYKAIDSIRVVRDYAARPIDDKELRLILNAGGRVKLEEIVHHERW